MGSRGLWIGAGLACAVLAAWIATRPEDPLPTAADPGSAGAEAAAAPLAAAPPQERELPLPSDLKALPPEIREQVEQALKDAGATDVRVASLNAQNARGRSNLQWLFTPPAADAPDWQREGWDKYMAPLLYPEGHPRAGQYRDSVSVEDVQAAAMPMAEPFFPPDYLDQPMLHVPEKRINFNELNQASARLWNRENPEATAAPFYEWLQAAPEDPSAYASDFWLPAPPNHPDATTHRAWLRDEVGRQVRQQIEVQRSAGGS